MSFRRKILFLLLLLLSQTALRGAVPRRGYVISPKNAESVVTEASLYYAVSFLADSLCDGRQTGTPGSVWAQAWMARSFAAQGLQPPREGWYDAFLTGVGTTGHNVLGFLPGTGRGLVVVTAHYDNIGRLGGVLYPGADSNASGVAALLHLSAMFRRLQQVGRTYGRTVLFVALDGKEQSLSGAAHLVRLLREGGLHHPVTGDPVRLSDVDLLVNLDQLGATLSPLHEGRPDYLMMLAEGPAASRRDLLITLNRREHLDLDLAFNYYGSVDFTRLFYRRVSDQKPFLEAGVPSVMFTSGITLLNNKPYDLPESLDYAVLRKRVLLIFHWLSRQL